MDKIERDDVSGETERIHCNLQSLIEEIDGMHSRRGEDAVPGGCWGDLLEELRTLQRDLASATERRADTTER